MLSTSIQQNVLQTSSLNNKKVDNSETKPSHVQVKQNAKPVEQKSVFSELSPLPKVIEQKATLPKSSMIEEKKLTIEKAKIIKPEEKKPIQFNFEKDFSSKNKEAFSKVPNNNDCFNFLSKPENNKNVISFGDPNSSVISIFKNFINQFF